MNIYGITREYNNGKFSNNNQDNFTLKNHETFWLRFEVSNKLYNSPSWMLKFNSPISHVWIYIMNEKDSLLCEPIESIAINNISRHKVLIPFGTGEKKIIYLKIFNQISIDTKIPKMELLPQKYYELDISIHGFFIGIILGGYVIIFILSLQICFSYRRKEYIFYSLYIVCNAIFVVFGSFVTDKLLFPHDPWSIFGLYSSLMIGHMNYILFVRYFVEPENIPEKTNRYFFRPIMYFILIVNPLVTILSFFDYEIFKIVYDYVILTDAFLGLLLSLLLFRIPIKPVKLILLGSFIMILSGTISYLGDLLDFFKENYLYHIGVLIELFLFIYAISVKQNLAKKKQEEKEKAFYRLQHELAEKTRELTQKVIYSIQTEQMLRKLKKNLSLLDIRVSKNKRLVQDTMLNIEVFRNQNSMEDFDKYFTEIHPDFFIRLKQKYPTLSSNEVRLCAMLRLALSTKEIAAISQKTPKSVDVMRNRMRNKMELDRNDRLYDILIAILKICNKLATSSNQFYPLMLVNINY